MRENTPGLTFLRTMLKNAPGAAAWVTGNNANPGLSGLVKFYVTPYGGILVEAEFFGLSNLSVPGGTGYYAMHIHENGDCTLPFDRTGMHYSRSEEPSCRIKRMGQGRRIASNAPALSLSCVRPLTASVPGPAGFLHSTRHTKKG